MMTPAKRVELASENHFIQHLPLLQRSLLMKTRKEQAAIIKPLLKQGLEMKTIAAEMGISRSYVFSLRDDPNGTRERERKRKYGGRCATCGRRTDGSNGKRGAPRYCKYHYHQHIEHPQLWPKERIITAIQDWTALYGKPPTSIDWNQTQLRTLGRHEDAERFDKELYPWFSIVITRFGNWGAALEAAGFDYYRAYTTGKKSKASPEKLQARLDFVRELIADGVPRIFIMRRVWEPWGYSNMNSLSSTLTTRGVGGNKGWMYLPYRVMTDEEWERAKALS